MAFRFIDVFSYSTRFKYRTYPHVCSYSVIDVLSNTLVHAIGCSAMMSMARLERLYESGFYEGPTFHNASNIHSRLIILDAVRSRPQKQRGRRSIHRFALPTTAPTRHALATFVLHELHVRQWKIAKSYQG